MEVRKASGDVIVVKEGGGLSGEWPPLSVRDSISTLRQYYPDKDAANVSVFDLDGWVQNEEGSSYVLLLSARKRDPSMTLAAINRMGNVLDRVRLARYLFGETLITGEEPEAEEGESEGPKAESPATG